jgi:hypothetical protein
LILKQQQHHQQQQQQQKNGITYKYVFCVCVDQRQHDEKQNTLSPPHTFFSSDERWYFTPKVNFTSILRTAFSYKSFAQSFFVLEV